MNVVYTLISSFDRGGEEGNKGTFYLLIKVQCPLLKMSSSHHQPLKVVERSVAQKSLERTSRIHDDHHGGSDNHLEDAFQRFLYIPPAVESTQTKIAFAGRTKAAAGRSDDVRVAQQQVKEVPA